MNLTELTNLFDDLRTKVELARQEMSANAKALIQQAANELFTIAPDINSVFWTQFTPYFNDGEPCYFSVGDFYYTLEGDEADDYEGSYIPSADDIKRSKRNLDDVILYEKDNQAYIDLWKSRYKLYNGSDFSGNTRYIKPYPSTVEEAQESLDEMLNLYNKYPNADEINNAFTAFCSAMSKIPDEIMDSIYGDHVRVTITRDGTDVDHYDHE